MWQTKKTASNKPSSLFLLAKQIGVMLQTIEY